jgi:hypothetical protein
LPGSYADTCNFPLTSSINIHFRPFWTRTVSKTKYASFEVVLSFSATFSATVAHTSILRSFAGGPPRSQMKMRILRDGAAADDDESTLA